MSSCAPPAPGASACPYGDFGSLQPVECVQHLRTRALEHVVYMYTCMYICICVHMLCPCAPRGLSNLTHLVARRCRIHADEGSVKDKQMGFHKWGSGVTGGVSTPGLAKSHPVRKICPGMGFAMTSDPWEPTRGRFLFLLSPPKPTLPNPICAFLSLTVALMVARSCGASGKAVQKQRAAEVETHEFACSRICKWGFDPGACKITSGAENLPRNGVFVEFRPWGTHSWPFCSCVCPRSPHYETQFAPS